MPQAIPDALAQALHDVRRHLENAAQRSGRPCPRLLAVGKAQPAAAIARLTALRQALGEYRPALGENYVQEAQARQAELGAVADAIEWHLIGHLQSNKARIAATLFDWVQTLDRPALADALARQRLPAQPPLNVLIQVNIDGEAGKHGCRPEAIAALAAAVAAQPRLVLRGLMAIPAPHAAVESRRPAFARMKRLFDELAARRPQIDTLSMGMSDDYAIAIEEGATMVRVGTALFGQRG